MIEALQQTAGEFAGWQYWDSDPFENDIGPFFFRKEEAGYVGAFRAERKHMNSSMSMHGGCMMSFADFGLFVIAKDELGDDNGVTVTMNSEFLGGAQIGELVKVSGDVLRAGGSLIFVRGMITAEDRLIFNFSGTIKRLRNKAR